MGHYLPSQFKSINNVIHCSTLFSPFFCQRCCCLKDHRSTYKKECAHNPINRKRSARHSFIFSMKKDQESDNVFYARRSLLISHHFDHIKMSSCKIRQHPGTVGRVQSTIPLFQECEFLKGRSFHCAKYRAIKFRTPKLALIVLGDM